MNYSQLKRVLEEGLHHDHTTDGEYHNSEIKQSLDIRKFFHEPMANVLKEKQSRKPLKSIQPTVINGSTMKTRTLVLKHQLTVKYLIFWPRGQLLVEKKKKTTTTTNLTRSRRKKTSKSHPTTSKIATFWTPPSPQNFRCPPWGGYGYFLELHNSCIIHVENIGDEKLNLDLITIGIHWTKIKGAYFVAKVTCNVENYHDDFSLITGHLFHVIAIRTTVDE